MESSAAAARPGWLHRCVHPDTTRGALRVQRIHVLGPGSRLRFGGQFVPCKRATRVPLACAFAGVWHVCYVCAYIALVSEHRYCQCSADVVFYSSHISLPDECSTRFSPAEFIIMAYGTVLAPMPGGDAEQGNLSRALGSIVGTACLRAEGGVGPQLMSHVFGLLKARNVPGLSEEDYWLATDEGTEWVIRTVDKLLDVVKPELGDGAAAPQAKL